MNKEKGEDHQNEGKVEATYNYQDMNMNNFILEI